MPRSLTAGLLTVAALSLSACSADAESGHSSPVGVTDASLLDPVDFDEVTTDDCLGGTSAIEGRAPVAPCDTDGAVPVESVVMLGNDAPDARPTDEAIVAGYATAACGDAVESYAERHSIPTEGLLRIAVVSDIEWQGADTPVVCAVLQVS